MNTSRKWSDAWERAYKRRAYGFVGAMPAREEAKMNKALSRMYAAEDRCVSERNSQQDDGRGPGAVIRISEA